MSEWDRKALLHLVDEAGHFLETLPPNAPQRSALQSLMADYSAKAKSVTARREDVQSLEGHLAQIMAQRDGEG